MICYDMICYDVICYDMCYDIICYVMSRHIMLCYAMLCYGYLFIYSLNYFFITYYFKVWLPNQLQIEYDQKLWLSVTAPVTAIFDDKNNDIYPLWGRLVASFPPDRLKGTKKITEIIESEEKVNVLSASSISNDNRDIIVESDGK